MDEARLQELLSLGAEDVTAPPELGAEDVSVSEDRLQDLLAIKTIDGNTSQSLVPQVSGASPDQAINASVLSLPDRTAMSFGNLEGNLKYLKEKYGNAELNSAGRLTIKQNGAWYLADPNVDEVDGAWQVSKEIFADTIADQLGPMTTTAGAIGGAGIGGAGGLVAGTAVAPGPGTIAGTGAGVAGGAIVGAAFGEYLRTSLGRYLGTYEATPEEQVRDIALESMLEIGGQKILPGMKPTAKKVVSALEDFADKYAKGPVKKGADILWDFYGSLATSPAVTRTFRENPKRVIKIIKDNGGTFSSPTNYIDNIVSQKIDDVAKFAQSAPKLLSKGYLGVRKQIVDAVPDSFQGDARMYAAKTYAKYLDEGVSKLVKPTGEIVSDPKEFATTLNWIKENNRLPNGWKVSMKSQQEINQLVNSGLPVDPAWRRAAVNEDAYKAMREAHDIFAGFSQKFPARFRDGKMLAQRGKGEASRLLDDKKELSGTLFQIADDNTLSSMGDVSGYINGVRKNLDDLTVKHFDQYGVGDKFQEMNGLYTRYSEKLLPLMRANKNAKTQGKQAYETLMNQLASRPGKSIARKEGLDELVGLAGRIGDKAAEKQLTYLKQGLDAADAALALNPMVTRRAAGFGMTAYGALSANSSLLGAMAVTGAATNTTIQQGMLRANYLGFEALKGLKSMSREQVRFIMDNPTAATTLIRSIQSAEQRGEMVENAFSTAFPPVPMQGPGDAQQ